MPKQHGTLPPIQVQNHDDGNLHAEIGDVAVHIGKALEVLTAVRQYKRTAGAIEAILIPLYTARAEINDAIGKVLKGGFNQQTTIDVTPAPIAPKRGLWRTAIAKNVQGYRLRGAARQEGATA